MKKTFTQNYMAENRGCYSFVKLLELGFYSNEVITIEDIMNCEIPQKDKFWFLFNKCELTKLQKQELCLDLAEIVLPIYENKYPENKTPREAINASRKYLKGLINAEAFLIARRGAYDAADDADDINAAYAAAAAAYAFPADVVTANAATNATEAYPDEYYKTKLHICVLEFIKNN